MEVRASLPRHPVPVSVLASGARALRVEGLVDRPLTLRPDDLAHLARAKLAEPFACEEGWQTPALVWEGVRLRDVLGLAGPHAEGSWVRVSAGDYTVPLPVAEAADAVLADSLDGEPLSIEHGAPWRLVLPGASCFTSVKWVDRLELATESGDASGERIARARLNRDG